MPLLNSTAKSKKEAIRVNVSDDLLKDIRAYCDWANIAKESHFMEQAAQYVLSHDKDWQKQLSRKDG